MLEYIFFDLDGTIANSKEGVTTSVAYSLKKLNAKELDAATLEKFIGPPLVDSYIKYCGFTREEALEAINKYREYYKEMGIYKFALYEGIKEMLLSLKENGKKLYIATSKPEIFANIILKKAEILEIFDGVFGATLDSSRVKKADVLKYALSTLKLKDTSKAVLVGDTVFDIEGAKSLGLASLAVTYGYENVESLVASSPDFLAGSVAEITSTILSKI